jgi:hypothetical protein
VCACYFLCARDLFYLLYSGSHAILSTVPLAWPLNACFTCRSCSHAICLCISSPCTPSVLTSISPCPILAFLLLRE